MKKSKPLYTPFYIAYITSMHARVLAGANKKTEVSEKRKMEKEKKGKVRHISLVKGRLHASIPANVLTALHLSEGDELVWTVEGEKAIAMKKEGGD